MRGLLFLSLLFPGLAQGAHIVKVSEDQLSALIDHPSHGRWNQDDYVCAIKDKKEVACGYVLIATGRGAAVQWDFRPKSIENGLEVIMASDAAKKKHATTWGINEKWDRWEEASSFYKELVPFRETNRPEEYDLPMDDKEQLPKKEAEEEKLASSKDKVPLASPEAKPPPSTSPVKGPKADAAVTPPFPSPSPSPHPSLKPAPLLPSLDTK